MYVEKHFAIKPSKYSVETMGDLTLGSLYHTLKDKGQHSFWGRLLRVGSGELKETSKEKET